VSVLYQTEITGDTKGKRIIHLGCPRSELTAVIATVLMVTETMIFPGELRQKRKEVTRINTRQAGNSIVLVSNRSLCLWFHVNDVPHQQEANGLHQRIHPCKGRATIRSRDINAAMLLIPD
jgi:hypothetical protein